MLFNTFFMIYIKLTLSIVVLLFSFIGPYNSYLNHAPFNTSNYLNVAKGESIYITIAKISDLNFINKLFLRIHLNYNKIHKFQAGEYQLYNKTLKNIINDLNKVFFFQIHTITRRICSLQIFFKKVMTF